MDKWREYNFFAASGGFTLLELVMVIALISILALLAGPSFQTQILNSRMAGASSDLVRTLATAKSESIGRNAFITVCKRNTAGSDCDTSGGWENGWLIFIDADSDAAVDTGEDILYVQEPLTEMTVRGTAQIANNITYRPSGLTELTSLQAFMLCDERGFGDAAQAIILSVIGRATQHKAAESGQSTCLTS